MSSLSETNQLTNIQSHHHIHVNLRVDNAHTGSKAMSRTGNACSSGCCKASESTILESSRVRELSSALNRASIGANSGCDTEVSHRGAVMEGIAESELCLKDPGREMICVSLGTDGDEDDGGISGMIKSGRRSKSSSVLYCGATVLLDGRVGDNGECVVEAAVTVAGRG
ncbi:hypothetical protein BGW80DRAFT_1325953 [Lactifluus volemus]|nr:hypothetical protein BGW80DRAFT_1325953 [Lactifluus volemus]